MSDKIRLKRGMTVFYPAWINNTFKCQEGEFIMSIGGRYSRIKRKDNSRISVYEKVLRSMVFTNKEDAKHLIKNIQTGIEVSE